MKNWTIFWITLTTSAGTVAQGTDITPNATAWKTNNSTTQLLPTIVEYVDPDGTNTWTKTTLDSMQAGYKLTTAPGTAGRRIDDTKVWATVDYTPAAAAATSGDSYILFFGF